MAFLYVISCVLGTMGAWTVMRYGHALNLVDIPKGRSSHSTPTPKGGGVGILAAFIISAIWVNISFQFWAPVVVLALVSLLGDKHNVSVGIRLVVQLAAAIIVLWSGLSADEIGILSLQSSMIILISGIVFGGVFIAGTANIYNFMDGINGIAAITGIVGFSLLAWYASNIRPDSSEMMLCLCLAFSCLGFLPFNMPRAKVFMGDVGSILLGFVFAVIVVVLADNVADFFVLAACLFPFYADELTTMFVRIKDGEQLSRPHRRHLYQLLANEMGIAHWKISLGYGLCQLLVGLSAIIYRKYGVLLVLVLLCGYFVGFAIISFLIRRNILKSDLN